MLSYVINFTNLIWGLSLTAALFAAKKYTTMTEKEQENIIKKVESCCASVSFTVIICGLWLALRCLYALGLLLLVELILLIGAVCYITRINARCKTTQLHETYRLLQSTESLKSLLGSNLPQWLKYPGANRAQWLNSIIAGMWNHISFSAETSLRQVIEPLLATYKPSFIRALTLKELSLGSNPIVINGIQHQQSNDDSSIIDITLSWDGDVSAHLHIELPGPDMHVYIRRFEVNMMLRVILLPHISQWPCFAAISLSILDIWMLDFDISAAGVSLDSVPAVGEFLDKFIRSTIVGTLQYPKSISIPIVSGYTLPTTKADVAIGTLRVFLLRVENWKQRYLSERKNTPFYVKVIMNGPDSKKRLKSENYKGLDSELNDKFSFVLYDRNKTLHFWLYFDVFGNDYCVGECDVSVETLIKAKDAEYECHLLKSIGSTEPARATLIISSEYLPYSGKNKNGSILAPINIPSRKVSDGFLQRAALGDQIVEPPTTRSLKNGSLRAEERESGTLFITVVRCTGLKNMEHIGISDPYVVLRLGNEVRESQYVSSTLDPIFNFETEMDVLNVLTDRLQILIMDKNDVRKDTLMGSFSIPVNQVANSLGEKLVGTFNLNPQGKINLILRFLQH